MIHPDLPPHLQEVELGDPGRLVFENGVARVWELVLQPGQWCGWHRHELDHFLIVTGGAAVQGIFADGRESTVDIPDSLGLFVRKSDLPEIARNVSPDRTLRELIVELKSGDPGEDATRSFQFFTDLFGATPANSGR